MSFHVPEGGRIRSHPFLASTSADGHNGAFQVPSPEPGWILFLICSDGSGEPARLEYQWEHVSVHAVQGARDRTPTWKEMAFVKDLCWDEDDVVMQLHPRRAEYVNVHAYTLHLWRPRLERIPTPPAELVGPVQTSR